MPRQDPAYLYEQTQERTLHEKNLKIEDLERQADAFRRDVESASACIAALEAEIAALKAHIVKSDNFERNGEYPTSCLFEAKELLDERRALLNGGGK